jgi:radical SAM protein (TIGR01212 family)
MEGFNYRNPPFFIMQYRTYRAYIKERFGKPVLKVPVNAGFSCPNRDGTTGRSGCSFCDNEVFSPVAHDVSDPLEQLKRAIAKASGRFEAFIPYFQPFSNTYGTVDALKRAYEPVIACPGVVGIAVGTRPDCFNDGIYAYLEDVAARTYLSVELGLQSSDDEILKKCNRGHTFAQFEQACRRLSAAGAEVVAHVMAGLPGDTDDSLRRTAQSIASLPVHGVKIHQLMIIRGTAMEDLYLRGGVEALSLEKYACSVGIFLSHIRPGQCVHRIAADTRPDKGLIAPEWSLDKKSAVDYINRYLEEKGITQGMFAYGSSL